MKLTKDQFAYVLLDSIEGIKINAKRCIMRLFDVPSLLVSNFSDYENEIKSIIEDIPYKRLKGLVNSRKELKEFYNDFVESNCNVVCIDTEDYPEKFYQLDEPPFVLYYRGNLKLLECELVLFSGTRSCTRYGIDITKSFTKNLVENDIVLLSGISDGIDTALIEETLNNGGQNVVFTAGGIDKVAPAINKDLALDVEKTGLIISEQRPCIVPQRFHYLYRNRLLAAICDVVVLVEADEESKSLGVINLANEYGKEVFAVPGNLTTKVAKAPNTLIANETARILVNPKQIVEVFRDEYYYKSKKIQSFDEEELKIMEALKEKPMHFDEIVNTIDLTYSTIMTKLFLLESKKVIRKIAGNCYEIIEEV